MSRVTAILTALAISLENLVHHLIVQRCRLCWQRRLIGLASPNLCVWRSLVLLYSPAWLGAFLTL